jgi:RES domain
MVSPAPADPPPDLHSRTLPIELLGVGHTIYRIHKTSNPPKFFGRSGDWRFDAPDRKYGVLYAATTPAAAFAETLLRGPGGFVAISELETRSLCKFTVVQEIALVSIYGPHLFTLAATAAVTSGAYGTSQRWSEALWTHPQEPHGVIYRATHDNNNMALALFDRAARMIDDGESIPLMDDTRLLGRILDEYRAAVR